MKRAVAAAGIILCTAFAIPGDAWAERLKGVYAKAPFSTETARENFRKCFPEIEAADMAKLSATTQFGYEFETIPCPPGVTCRPGTTLLRVQRRTIFDSSTVSPAYVRQVLRQFEGGDCGHTSIENFRADVGRNSVDYFFHPVHQDQFCWGGFKTDTTRSEVDVHANVSLSPDFSLTQSQTNSNPNSKLFGLLDLKVFLGPLADWLVVVPPVVPLALGLLRQNAHAPSADAHFAGTSVNLYQYTKVSSRLSKLGLYEAKYDLRRDLSGFMQEGGQVFTEVIEQTQLDEDFIDTFIDYRNMEIEFLNSLQEVSGQPYTVKKGDNLWALVRSKYRDARLFLVIADMNGVKDPSQIRVGQTLTLPRWQQLCEKLKKNPMIVEAGDSIWTKSQRGEIAFDPSHIRTYSGNADLIYPLEVLSVGQSRK